MFVIIFKYHLYCTYRYYSPFCIGIGICTVHALKKNGNWLSILLFIRLLSSDSKAKTTIPDSPSLGLGNKRWSTCSVGSNSIDTGTTSDSPETPENYDEVCGEADTYHQWGQLIGNWSDAQRKKPRFVRDMVRRGVPNALRGMVWQLLCEARDFPLRDQYPQLIKVIFEFREHCSLYVHVHACTILSLMNSQLHAQSVTMYMCFICSLLHVCTSH